MATYILKRVCFSDKKDDNHFLRNAAIVTGTVVLGRKYGAFGQQAKAISNARWGNMYNSVGMTSMANRSVGMASKATGNVASSAATRAAKNMGIKDASQLSTIGANAKTSASAAFDQHAKTAFSNGSSINISGTGGMKDTFAAMKDPSKAVAGGPFQQKTTYTSSAPANTAPTTNLPSVTGVAY